MHYRRVSISGERAGARSVAGRQHVFGSPRCNDDLRQLPSGHSDNASQRSKVSELCRHCQPTDNHGAFFETVPAFQPQPNAKVHTLTRRYRRCRRLYPQHQAEIAFTFAVALRMRMAKSGIYRGSPLGPECQSVDVSNGSNSEVVVGSKHVRWSPRSGPQARLTASCARYRAALQPSFAAAIVHWSAHRGNPQFVATSPTYRA